MPKQTTFANDFLALVFNATAIADLAENDTTAPLTNLYVSLHTAPGANWAAGVMAVPLSEAHTLLCAGRSSVVLQIQAEGINDWFVPLAVAQGEI